MIEVKNLTKKFGEFTAVDNISFSVKEGEVFAFLGPNGAGKTTTINMLATLLNPTSGQATVLGFDITKQKDEVRSSIGIIFQDPALDDRLTAKENLDFHARLYGLDKGTRKKRIAEVLDLVDLKEKANIVVKEYSGGMKRRLEIARGLMHYPKVLFLDEPTLGLDPQTRRNIWNYIQELNQKEKITIVLTTHYMEEADYLCNRVAIVDYGKIVELDTPQNLKNILGGDVISMEVFPVKRALEIFKKLPWVKKAKEHNSLIDLNIEKGEDKIPLLLKVDQKEEKFKIKSISLRKPTLEDVFLHFTGRTIREEEAKQSDRNKFARQRRY